MGNTIECNVVMLAAEGSSHLWILNGKLEYNQFHTSHITDNCLPQHIYFTSDEKIKMRDWYIDDANQIRQCVISDSDYWVTRKEYKKIEASTDTSIGLLPAIPHSFIQKFVKANEEIRKVKLYAINRAIRVPDTDINGQEPAPFRYELEPKLTLNNEVRIVDEPEVNGYSVNELARKAVSSLEKQFEAIDKKVVRIDGGELVIKNGIASATPLVAVYELNGTVQEIDNAVAFLKMCKLTKEQQGLVDMAIALNNARRIDKNMGLEDAAWDWFNKNNGVGVRGENNPYMKAFIAGAKFAIENKWVSVDDRKPNKHQLVLVFGICCRVQNGRDSIPTIGLVTWDSIHYSRCKDMDGDHICYSEITHWCESPNPPKL